MDIEYKGFKGKIFFSAEAGTFCGEIINAKDIIAFLAPNLKEAILVMEEAINEYLSYLSK